jgi:hypothetical protein
VIAVAKQYSFFDLRDEHSIPVLEDPALSRARVTADPQSIRDITDGVVRAGAQSSGQRRANVARDVNDALWEAYVTAWAILGTELDASALLLHWCSRDPKFDPPEWLRSLWGEYASDMADMFRVDAVDRDEDYLGGDMRESLVDVDDLDMLARDDCD